MCSLIVFLSAILTAYYVCSVASFVVESNECPSGIKTIHFIRHAQGEHNLKNEKGKFSLDIADAQLTRTGREQCAALNSKAAHPSSILSQAELIVVSPMQRTLETAVLSFSFLKHKIPWVASEDVREISDEFPCDRRSTISEYANNKEFSHIDFGGVAHNNEDPLSGEEVSEEVIGRCGAFLAWLATREETNIIVVTHKLFLAHMMDYIYKDAVMAIDIQPFMNTEVREVGLCL